MRALFLTKSIFGRDLVVSPENDEISKNPSPSPP